MQLLLEKKSLIITMAVTGKNTSHSLFLLQNPLFPLTISFPPLLSLLQILDASLALSM